MPTRPTVCLSCVISSVTCCARVETEKCVDFPPRTTVKSTVLLGSAVTRSSTSSQVWIGAPFTAMMLSPRASPAAAAGCPGSTESITAGTYGRPYAATFAVFTTIASTAFIVTPASSIIRRAASGFDSNQRFSGTGSGPNGASAFGSQSFGRGSPV